jgi:Tfp pilus assembly protein PilX
MAMKNRLFLQNQSGSALVIALIILVVLTLISLSSSITSITEINLSGNKRGSADAFYAADGGIQAAMAQLSNFDSSTSDYALIASTGGISQDIINQSVDKSLPSNKVTFPAGVTFTPPPIIKIYHETNTGCPKGMGMPCDGSVIFAYYIIDSTGMDQAGTDLLRPQSEVVTTVVRVLPAP